MLIDEGCVQSEIHNVHFLENDAVTIDGGIGRLDRFCRFAPIAQVAKQPSGRE
jgi:hypothetical protein